MERKIGKILEYNGEWYQCVKDKLQESCVNCCFYNGGHKKCDDETVGNCLANSRSDGYSVCFKKLEKVGEPYEFDGYLFQSYRTFEVPIFTENYATVREYGNNSKISIEIKQNKEDMEEKKLNLKPFNLEAAKAGKPVCTRDGRKARIICFDAKGGDNPIVALYEHTDGSGVIMEIVEVYHKNGKILEGSESRKDLMMLPEKKEGWVNVYKERIYSTKEEAIEATYDGVTYVDTIKISWEE